MYKRLLDEARCLNGRCKPGSVDGYRDGGIIMGIWSDNVAGTKDDMQGKSKQQPC